MAATFLSTQASHGKCHVEMDQITNKSISPLYGKEFLNAQQQIIPTSYIQTQIIEPQQGSISSLVRSFAEQSDVQPLTESHLCRYEECVKFHKTTKEAKEIDSPWSSLKNAFLYAVIFLLLLWIVVYTILNQADLV